MTALPPSKLSTSVELPRGRDGSSGVLARRDTSACSSRRAGRRRQRRVHDVAVEVEVLVGLPERDARRLDRPLPEAPEDEEPLVDQRLQPRDVEALAEKQHAA